MLSIFEALKTDQFHRQHKSYKRLLVSSNYEQMSKPADGDAWVVAPIPETSDDVGVMHSIANATVMLKMRTLKSYDPDWRWGDAQLGQEWRRIFTITRGIGDEGFPLQSWGTIQ